MKWLKFVLCGLCLWLTANSLFAFNYGEALQKAIYFYEAQQAGPLPAWNRVEWRADASMLDPVLGGWYDAGDHVKFNLPMSYSASMLGWAIYEYASALSDAGQLDILKNNLRFVLDYLMECTARAPYVFQVGNGTYDHTWWGPVEMVHLAPQAGDRSAITASSNISCVLAQTAAALAIGGKVLGNSSYISRARDLYTKAAADESDTAYNASNASSFYKSNSGPIDELQWAATWLYIATGTGSYLTQAEAYVNRLNRQPNIGVNVIEYKWGHCWDDSHYGAMLMLAKLTGKQVYTDFVRMHLDWWSVGYGGDRISTTPGGLAWLTSWGALRHATTTAFLAFVYADWVNDPALQQLYRSFGESQIDYALGDNPRNSSYVIGYGRNSPQHPHHRTAHGSWTNNMDIPANHRHVLYGALVGGPDAGDGYKDDITDFVMNEVACDYNAGFVGALAKMYSLHGGNPLADFPPAETKDIEFFVEGTVSGSGNSVSMQLQVNNRSAWPARVYPELKFRYFMDLSELSSASGISTVSYYSEVTNTISSPTLFAGSYYYIEVDFDDGSRIWPGGNAEHAAEVQLNIQGPPGFNNSNDWSYLGFTAGGGKNSRIVIYNGNTVIWGQEPPGGPSTPVPTNTPTPPPVTFTPTPAGCLRFGDVNGDGLVTIVDALMTAQAYVGLNPPNFNAQCADVNSDGKLTIVDALVIAQYYVGLINSLPLI